jgi:hypothetical protein
MSYSALHVTTTYNLVDGYQHFKAAKYLHFRVRNGGTVVWNFWHLQEDYMVRYTRNPLMKIVFL